MQAKASSAPSSGAARPDGASARARGFAARSAAAVALLAIGCGPGALPASVGHPLAGNAAPEFHADSTAARPVGVPGSRRVRVTVIDFWAPWCAACIQTVPALDALWRDRKADGVMVIGVGVDASDSAADAGARQLGASFPIVADPDQRLAGAYGVAKVPLTFVVDSGGTVRWVGRDPASARRAVDVLLYEGPAGARQRSVFE
jgi:cytochrome c biogenesis protein CcmG, thiol:disulfide interchange protein DsbE